jgi:hypothetical protein
MPKVRPETLREVQQAFQRYTDTVEQSGLSVGSRANYLIHARAFIRWLNDDFEPGKHLLRPKRTRG